MTNFPYINGAMHIEDVAIAEIAKTVATPFYCYSSSAISENYNQYKSAFSQINSLICFAVKSNSNQAVLKTLAKLGAGADVVSEGEIRRALAAGIPANKIVFSGVAKTNKEIAYALSKDILQFNVESEPELEEISKVALSLNKIAAISIRVNPDVCAKTHAKISTGKAENKFGIPISTARSAYLKASKLPGIKVQGVDVHIGSQLTDLSPFSQAYKKIAELVAELKKDGHPISIIDIGGGLGIDYGESEDIPTKKEYADIAKQHLAHLNCKIIVEPGRSLVGNSGILVTSVVYVKKGQERDFLILDAGMNDLIRPSMYDAFHQIVPVNKNNNPSKIYDIVGPVCETGDTFCKNTELEESSADDLIVIMSCGAYGAVMSSTYNSRMLTPEVMVNKNDFAIIRDRPTYQQFMDMDILPEWLIN